MRAVAYLRRSSSKQEKSITAQRKAVEQYATKRGYVIVDEYIDDGISGDNNEARKQFLRMRDDLTSSDIADVVLVWAYDRVSRNDSDEESAAMFPLREAGIMVDSVTEGTIDRDSFEGRITHTVRQEGRHSYIRDLAKNSLRGRINAAQLGHIAGQAAPYGFDRMIVDADGQHILRMKNGDPKPTRAGNTHVSLVASDDAEIVATLRWIFAEFSKPHVGLRTIASKLTQRGVPGPQGPKWWPNTIRHILANQNYIGTYVFGKRTEAKFYKVSSDGIQERSKADVRRAGVRKNDESEQIIVENAFDGLIDRDIFDAVQAKLSRQKQTQRKQSRKPDRYLLSGMAICGCCGQRMTGAPKTNTRQKDAYRYVCATYMKSGHRDKHAGGCFYGHVDGELLERSVLDRIQQTVLSDKNLAKIETALRRKLKSRIQKQPDPKPLQRKLAKLNADIDKAADRLLRADDDLMDILAPRLRTMRQDRDRVASELKTHDRQNSIADADRIVAESMEWLNEISTVIRQGSPQERRDVLLSIVDTIEVEFEQEQRGSRTFSKVVGATITYNKRIRDESRISILYSAKPMRIPACELIVA